MPPRKSRGSSSRSRSGDKRREKERALEEMNLFEAIDSDDIEKVKECIESGADVNMTNSSLTPLHVSLMGGTSKEIIELLIANGADINARNSHQSTPLHMACMNDVIEVAKILIDAGAEIDAKNNLGITPLHLACKNGGLSTVEALIERGADMDIKSNDGHDAMWYAKHNNRNRNSISNYLSRRQFVSNTLLTDFLSKCTARSSGSYVNHGSYGVGLTYKITEPGIQSPFEFLTLSHLLTGQQSDNHSIFLKIIPLADFSNSWDIDVGIGSRIESSEIDEFVDECSHQVSIFKQTNNNLDSFVLPIYEAIILSDTDLHVIKRLRDCYNFRDPNNKLSKYFFGEIIKNIKMSNAKLGLIVMPMMSIPPVSIGWDNMSSSVVPTTRKMFQFSQIISYMINLLELGLIHGDLHKGNTIYHPDLPNSTQCFKDGVPNKSLSEYYGKLFLLDFGMTGKARHYIDWNVSDDYEKFKLQIKLLLIALPDNADYTPMEWEAYQWLPDIFLKRDRNTRNFVITDDYTMQELQHGEMFTPENDTDIYFFKKNFEIMYAWVTEFRKGNSKFIAECAHIMDSYKVLFDKMREFNRSQDVASTMRGGGKEAMGKMIENLKYGENTVKELKKKYSNAVKSESVKSESVKSKPAKSESAKSEYAKSESAKSEYANKGNIQIIINKTKRLSQKGKSTRRKRGENESARKKNSLRKTVSKAFTKKLKQSLN
jgi:hypothetical protein